MFFPVGDGTTARQQVTVAKRICGTCPVVAQCRAFALETNQLYGVWGGLDEGERLELRRRRRASTSQTPAASTAPAAGRAG